MANEPTHPWAEDPKVTAMVLCDHAHRDPATGKFTLLGVFDRIHAKAFPAAHGAFAIYIALTNLNGSYDLAVHALRGDDESGVGETRSAQPLVVRDPLARVELAMNLPGGLPLLRPGPLVFRLSANGRLLQDQVVSVVGPG